jgi:rhamnulokinase
MAQQVYIAVDLGASSGRLLLGRWDGQRLELEELHRFENGPVRVGNALHWNVLHLWQQILAGMQAAAARYPNAVVSVGVDTWGVDFGLLGSGDTLLANPHHYRDPRTRGVMERVAGTVGREAIFRETGLQFLPFNTLFQLVAMREAASPLLNVASKFLMMPDLFHWLLCGIKANERTNASTTQFYNPTTGRWSVDLLKRFDLPVSILGPIIEPGTRLGPLVDWVADLTGLKGVQVVAPATHDTASAIVAAPAAGDSEDWCYISSGTWSLLGAELRQPVLTDKCLELNFTNEVGIDGTIRLLKNISGLWLLQEVRRAWSTAGRKFDWSELSRMASQAPPLAALIDPDHPSFLAPTDMSQAIRSYWKETGQPQPGGEGAMVRSILESLALKYRHVLEALEQVAGRRFSTIHIIGGGVQNQLLCQFAANACGRLVLAGPVEATAAGNALVQAMAAGSIGSVAEARQIVRHSFPVAEYHPQDVGPWNAAYSRLLNLLSFSDRTPD